LIAYHCRECGGYHFGHRSRSLAARIFKAKRRAPLNDEGDE